ncbi:DGC domain protein [Acididesulfobacillus acetoxydans]|uniref:DGC domain protein n=2 Tax=Acididesulfobacillus acetoxydans TaxID=1561005 RepID=A0A8S0VX29_9FIRM|nr:DGC domain protein [Acididesulfobacillus acetoxydans]CEJ07000.1 DGC domain protein [Acididesulfobacillus acetoxydans]
MTIGIFPCQGRCNVSMMTKTVAEFLLDDQIVRVLPNLSLPLNNESGVNEKYIALNGCPAKCASKEFELAKISPDAEIVITKDFDPKNNEKYAVLLNIDEEIQLVQEVIDRLSGGSGPF